MRRDVEGVDGAGGADQQGFDAEAHVVDGAGGRGEVEDVVDLAEIEGLADVLLDEAEARLVLEMSEVGEIAGAEVIDADDGVAFGEQSVA